MKLSDVLDVWGGGQLLAFSGLDGPTDFHHSLVARTEHDRAAIHVVLPAEARIIFDNVPPRRVFLAGDFFELETSTSRVRGAMVDDHHLLIEGPCRIERQSSDALSLNVKGDKTLLGVTGKYRADFIDESIDAVITARQAWLKEIEAPAGLSDARRRTIAKALSVMKTQVYSPQPPFTTRWTTPDRFPHRQLWLWDSAFHAIGWRHVDAALARQAIEAVLAIQHDDGMIPHMGSPVYVSNITQPPVLATAALLVHETQPANDWLAKLYDPLCRYLQWDLEHRISPDGLLHWFTHESTHCRCGESGMDNSPRFDTHDVLSAVDFNAYASLECESLAKIAGIIGRSKEALEWTNRRDRINERINDVLWNETSGLYVDAVAESGRQTGILSSAGFLPLICGAASDEQARRLAEHIDNPATFGTAMPVASIPPSQKAYYSKDMWRGPAWININWLISRGFERYNLTAAAKTIYTRTLAEMEKYYLALGTLHEYYDTEAVTPPNELLRKGTLMSGNLNQVLHDYGWSATLYVDMVFSNR